ncbi:TlpA family protein disulfide reductase [Sphingobacterium sp. LRF_L2]|uniref:TlpA family protein disulfide reductase n=1 Tax=Sphingobacterium sp. LRF_L2 TaxID=3369421 RepID=UPI003F600C00
MANTNEKKDVAKGLWQYIRKNSLTVLLVIFTGVMLLSPEAKSFVLRQLIKTGIFNTSIDKEVDRQISAPIDFDFIDENGNHRNTSSCRGKVVFINFWASWCPPCRAEFPSIEKLYSTVKDDPDIFFLTINEDSNLSLAKAYLNKEKFTVPLYTTHGPVPEEIYSGRLPTTVILDKKGNIRLQHTRLANYGTEKFIEQLKALAAE